MLRVESYPVVSSSSSSSPACLVIDLVLSTHILPVSWWKRNTRRPAFARRAQDESSARIAWNATLFVVTPGQEAMHTWLERGVKVVGRVLFACLPLPMCGLNYFFASSSIIAAFASKINCLEIWCLIAQPHKVFRTWTLSNFSPHTRHTSRYAEMTWLGCFRVIMIRNNCYSNIFDKNRKRGYSDNIALP